MHACVCDETRLFRHLIVMSQIRGTLIYELLKLLSLPLSGLGIMGVGPWDVVESIFYLRVHPYGRVTRSQADHL